MKLKDFQAFGANFAKAVADLKFAKNSQVAVIFQNATNLQVVVSKLTQNAKKFTLFSREKAAVFAALLSLSLSLSRLYRKTPTQSSLTPFALAQTQAAP